MAGLHGKNAELRISVSEQAYTAVPLTRVGSTRVFRAASNRRNWKWGRNLTVVTVDKGVVNGTEEIDPDSIYVHYPGGAVRLPDSIDIAGVSGITADATVMDLSPVSARPSATRQFNCRIETDVLDATTMGETFKSKVFGIPDVKGSLQGLLIDQTLWGLAIAGASGIIPTKVLRFRPDPLYPETYYQMGVIFPGTEMSAGFDSLIEENVDFEGQGPMQLVQDGSPVFPNLGNG